MGIDENLLRPKGGAEKINEDGSTRRDFLTLTASCVAAAGAAVVGVPFVSSLNPDQGVLAVGSTEVNVKNIQEGHTLTTTWRGKPVFIRHRTKAEIESARSVDVTTLRDPEKDEDRVKGGKEEWLVAVGVCTHLGCVPISGKGEFGGWFCPCHGSHYDTSGRIRKGPAPKNLQVPDYTFINDDTIKIG
ncbi:MAG: ubiquinol-cytochrome c reductase iron-sulfur subunit [Proteobacteria bacterium]|nr:ubiquinol-cytochrome c reductase iron-sulfur subunit [Pseudomonadota bacterium]